MVKQLKRMSDVAPFISIVGKQANRLTRFAKDGKHIRTKLTPPKTVENRLIALVYIFVIRQLESEQ